ncbi:unnamed protein product, partial [Rotaria socialis]
MGIIITLIDNAGLIQSHERATYIPIHDCNTKIPARYHCHRVCNLKHREQKKVVNSEFCLCLLAKMLPRCFIKSICQKNICMNGGLCVPHNDRISLTNFTCACQDEFSGKRCEYEDAKIDISFYDVSIPQSLLVHFITVREHDLESKFYLTVLQRIYTPSVTIPTKIARSQYYTQCQFNTQQFGLSLDAILGYQIRSNLPISRQSIYVKISVIVTLIMLLF